MFFSKHDKTPPPEQNAPQDSPELQDTQKVDQAVNPNPPVGVHEDLEAGSPFSAPFEKPLGLEEDDGTGEIERLDYPADKPFQEDAPDLPPPEKAEGTKGRGFLPPKIPEHTPAQQYAKAFGEQGDGVPDPGFDPRNKVLSVFAMLGFFVVMAIPLVNLIMAVRWTFGKKTNRNLRNLSITMLFFFALVLGVYLYLFFAR